MPKPKPNKYTSDLSAFCAEMLPGDFHYLDGDEVLLAYPGQPFVYARATRILRVLESKRPGEEIRRSQRETFPLFAELIASGVGLGLLAPSSGVFVVEGATPFTEGAKVSKVAVTSASRALGMQFEGSYDLTFDELCTFIRCRSVSSERKAAAA